MKSLVAIWLTVILAGLGVAFYINNSIDQVVHADTNAGVCPTGSYSIGGTIDNPVCKAQPTGCVYGDSIPLDQCTEKSGPAEVAPTSVDTTNNGPIIGGSS
jgi:hypothetical protein